LEVSTTLKAMSKPNIVCIGGRYGLGSKGFTPNMVLSVYENLKKAQIFCPVQLESWLGQVGAFVFFGGGWWWKIKDEMLAFDEFCTWEGGPT